MQAPGTSGLDLSNQTAPGKDHFDGRTEVVLASILWPGSGMRFVAHSAGESGR